MDIVICAVSGATTLRLIARLLHPVVPTEGNRGWQSRPVPTSPPVPFARAIKVHGLTASRVDLGGSHAHAAKALGSQKTLHEPTMGDYPLVGTATHQRAATND